MKLTDRIFEAIEPKSKDAYTGQSGQEYMQMQKESKLALDRMEKQSSDMLKSFTLMNRKDKDSQAGNNAIEVMKETVGFVEKANKIVSSVKGLKGLRAAKNGENKALKSTLENIAKSMLALKNVLDSGELERITASQLKKYLVNMNYEGKILNKAIQEL